MDWFSLIMYILPALLVLGTAYLILSQTAKQYQQAQLIAIEGKKQQNSLPLRLQAYERLVLFLERAEFSNLIPRLRDADMTAKELQFALISAIRQEYEHNITQQIYVSPKVWRSVVICKDELIKIINLVATTLPEDANGNMLARALFQYVMDNDEPMPTQRVLDVVRKEAASQF